MLQRRKRLTFASARTFDSRHCDESVATPLTLDVSPEAFEASLRLALPPDKFSGVLCSCVFLLVVVVLVAVLGMLS